MSGAELIRGWVLRPPATHYCPESSNRLVAALSSVKFPKKAVVCEADGSPEGNGAGIVTKNTHCHSLISWPHL